MLSFFLKKKCLFLCFCFFICTLLIIFPIFTKNIQDTSSITFKEYQYISSSTNTYIRYPHIEGIKDLSIAAKINTIIDDTVFNFLKEQPTSSTNCYDFYINYTVYHTDINIISFSLENLQIMASSYVKKIFFTFDVTTGQLYSISHFFNSHYQTMVKDQIIDQVKKQIKENSSITYFMSKINALQITDTQPFYINKEGNIVIVFDKYQIAPGYMGTPTFTITID